MIALDTETTGFDFYHGAKPFLITTFDKDGDNIWWEWDVNPETRQPIISAKELREVKRFLVGERVVLHNSKFDAKALHEIGVDLDWSLVDDTLIAAHIYSSLAGGNDLTKLAMAHLRIDVQPFEDAVRAIVNEARGLARREYPGWRIAKEGVEGMPSVKQGSTKDEDKPWKADMWLPRAIAKDRKYPKGHPWWDACSLYANSDTAVTYPLWKFFRKYLKENGYISLYKERMKLLPILFEMEKKGITYSHDRLVDLREEFQGEYDRKSTRCKTIAETLDYDLELPKAAMNNSLREFCFDEEFLDLPVIKKTQGGGPCLDKTVKESYALTLKGRQLNFVKSLTIRGKLATSLGYMESYERFALPFLPENTGWMVLHSSLNPVGTNTLRMSSYNPNQQQISKLEDKLTGKSLRYLFGPTPGKEWWSLDYDNLELRIPAYECEEPAMLELFNFPDKAPFFGSYHLLIVSILHPKEWKTCLRKYGPEGAAEGFKKKYKSTLYQWTKNGNFAELYGAVDRDDGDGTADRAYHLKGAQKKIASKLTKKKQLNDQYIRFAEENGFVYTLPDKDVTQTGYPLVCSRRKLGWSRWVVKPTIPLNYHVQGTACWVMMRAMIKVQEYLDSLGDGYRLVMNVHDEIVVEMPKKANKGNLPKATRIRELMESIGDCVGVTLTCGMDYHPNYWSQAC
jgi:DNA polymerase I-like protein with 3'-5' exonuclease and polymerase domains|tara:strand:- start:11115 stop:13160 length:2046 start_codon:yes stop_codon:yes gene_type:complete